MKKPSAANQMLSFKGALYYRSMASEASTAGVSLMDSYGHH